MDSAARLEQILGPDWQTLTAAQVTERARELGQFAAFTWKVKTAMRLHHAPTVGDVLHLRDEQPAAEVVSAQSWPAAGVIMAEEGDGLSRSSLVGSRNERSLPSAT
jgi:hypothetical protein